ncbi:MAG: hypothetical protein KJN85_15440, partial [Maribacter sp.]|nr:hypothetical protein [Maribacter sp.]
MKTLNSLYYLILLCLIGCNPSSQNKNSIAVSFAEAVSSEQLDGRLLLMFSDNNEKEPRFQINDGLDTQLIFGLNVEGMNAGENITFDNAVFGYPYPSLTEVPAGEYNVQALLHIYETFNLSTGHTVKLPMDNGEGQQWNRSPGNLYSKPVKVKVTEKGIQNLEVVMDQVIPPIEEPEDTEWIKHIKIKSEKLSEFWDRDVYLGAHVLLPKGFKEHPEAKYPLMVFHGHFPADFGGFRTTPPDPNMKPEYSARFDLEGYNIIQEQESYDFYKRW